MSIQYSIKVLVLHLSKQHTCILYCTVYRKLLVLSGSACTSRIAQYVGQGSEHMAKLVYRLTIIIHTACGLLTAATYVLLRYQLVGIFTDKEDVTELAVSLTVWVALTDIGKKKSLTLTVKTMFSCDFQT